MNDSHRSDKWLRRQRHRKAKAVIDIHTMSHTMSLEREHHHSYSQYSSITPKLTTMIYKSDQETVYRWGARMKASVTSTYPGSGHEIEQLLTRLSKRDIYKVNVEASTLHPALTNNIASLSRPSEMEPGTPPSKEDVLVSVMGEVGRLISP